ncbi:ketopantoate reductase family protein [Pseudoalteromonas sp. MMG012]|uniref:ketopantoate reductase family protein n=1 Tax=Pseudoalteromonas sp. MMG012 TaxID=2822686 RepID=UPI001B3A67F5|nr:2-dehydropantoate 2-reductase [Pseudoalteromonas sp. MMG012]MBQ4849999.1 2-dehydropantoate 2-reductase [Pseudoalteromonas sp. MMG012]
MNILIVGCGGIGGYFGARLLEAGIKVTFLARQNTVNRLKKNGLHLKSGRGDVSVKDIDALTKEEITGPFDVIILTCKSYDLAQSLRDCQKAVGRSTYILPMLNGFGHYEKIGSAFPDAQLLYGYCNVSTARNADGEIQHFNSIHEMTIGTDDIAQQDEVSFKALIELLKSAHFNLRVSKNIQQELWEKFTFINALAGCTTLLRGTIGELINTEHGQAVAVQIIDECQSVASAHGFSIRPRSNKITRDAFLQVGSPLSASMLKDIENNHRIELNLLSELCEFAAEKAVKVPLMCAAHSQLEVYLNNNKEFRHES